MKAVIVPAANEPDLAEIPGALRAKIEIHLARELDQVLQIALVGFKPAAGAKKAKKASTAGGSKKSRPAQPTVGMA
jgi:ATP-dependent Lon protease